MLPIDKTKVRRILVITLSNAGDIILTTPVVEAVIREFPESALDIMVGPSGKEIFEYHEKIRETIIYDKRTSPFEKLGLFVKLWKKRYDLIVDLKNTALPFMLRPRFHTSYFKQRQNCRIHKKDIHLSRLKCLGIDTREGKFYIPVTQKDKKRIEDLLGLAKEKPFIVVSPGAKSHVKRWSLKNFAKLCDMIKNDLRFEVIIIGDRYDRVVLQRILFYMKTKPINLLEKTNIRELAYLIKKAKLLITNDSAPLHVGSAVNTPTLAFFGPTDSRKYGPLTEEKKKVLKKDIKCSPCEVPQCVNTGNKYECLKTVSVEEAFETVKQLL